MILHAEHELNASTFTARVVAGTLSDMHSAVTAAICALERADSRRGERGSDAVLRGGRLAGAAPTRRCGLASSAKQTRLRVRPPGLRDDRSRARILKRLAESFSADGGEPNWYAIAEATERAVAEQKGLWPNVDLYSGPLYRYLGIPNDLFTPLFAASRVVGWAAHVLEQHANNKIIRPAAEYIGPERREFPVRAS